MTTQTTNKRIDSLLTRTPGTGWMTSLKKRWLTRINTIWETWTQQEFSKKKKTWISIKHTLRSMVVIWSARSFHNMLNGRKHLLSIHFESWVPVMTLLYRRIPPRVHCASPRGINISCIYPLVNILSNTKWVHGRRYSRHELKTLLVVEPLARSQRRRDWWDTSGHLGCKVGS